MKKRLLCPNLPTQGKSVVLSEDEAHHAIRVLRLRDGDLLDAIDGKGRQVQVALRIRGGLPRLEYASEPQSTDSQHSSVEPLPFILEMAVLKGEAMEWVVEKAVELNIQAVYPVLTAHTVVQMKNKGPESFQERWQKIADQALKQCGRLVRLEIAMPISLELLLSQTAQRHDFIRLWCDETSYNQVPSIGNWIQNHGVTPPSGHWRALIGPEGGWSSHEQEILLRESSRPSNQRIHLGPLTLRAETAAIFTASVVSAHLQCR